jgi:uncharacterized protein YsxB (DUF464 family)
MIKVLIKSEGEKLQSLEVKGHANSAPHGEDLVCAAVSAVVTGGANAIKNLNDIEIKLDEGYALLKVKSSLSSHDEIVMETIITGLKTIAEGNDKFIQIKNL